MSMTASPHACLFLAFGFRPDVSGVADSRSFVGAGVEGEVMG